MSSATLSKFTVPIDGSQPQGMLHPKLKYRFRVTFENFGAKGTSTTELTKQVVSFPRPTIQFEAIELPTYNSRIYVAGRHSWQTVQTVLRDDATGQVSKLVGQQVQKQFDFFEMSSAAAGIDYKFLTRLQVLDGGNGGNNPTVLEEWELYGCYLENVNYQEMNYGTNEAMTIQMTIKYDNANQKGANAGVGSAVTRTIGTNATGVGS
jgi:hypothetical protein